MGIFKRLFDNSESKNIPVGEEILILEGSDSLEIVGESYRQNELWKIVGKRTSERIRLEVIATIKADRENKYDPNAIAAFVNGAHVGFVAKELAAEINEELTLLLQQNPGKVIGLRGVIAGGGEREDGQGMLGLFLDYPAETFGERSNSASSSASTTFGMNSGKSDAFFTDLQDDSYDLSWMNNLSPDPTKRIVGLKKVLETNTEPISRHFAFSELEEILYHYKDIFPDALTQYDEIADRHQIEIGESIRASMIAKWGKLPNLVVHKQSAIRFTKSKNFEKALIWAQNGLKDYGQDAFKEEWVLDLQKRVFTLTNKIAKLELGKKD